MLRTVTAYAAITAFLSASAATAGCRTLLALPDSTPPSRVQQVESEHAIGTVFVVTERGELFSSFDEGATWSVLTPAIDPAGGTLAVTIDPTNPLIAYRSTYGGVFKSTDAGRNWRRVDRGFAYRPNGAVAIAPAAPATLYVAMSGVCDTPATCRGLGVMKSVDGGASWTSAGLEHLAVRAIAAASSSVVYAATALDDWGNVYRSVDGALTWYPLFAPPTWVHSWHVHPVDPSVIYARVEQRLFVLLVRSTNGARTWELIRPEIDGYQPPPCTPDAIDCVAEPTIGPLLFDPRHPGVLYSSDWQGVVRSHDGGFHWTYVAGGPGEETAMAAMRVDGSILYAVGRTAGSVGVYECTLPEPTELYAFFRPAVTEERIGRPIQFTDLSVGRITSRTWDFGDGSTTTGQQPSHAYSTAGTYRVTLTVSDGLASHTFSRSIEIFDGRRRAVTRSGKAPR